MLQLQLQVFRIVCWLQSLPARRKPGLQHIQFGHVYAVVVGEIDEYSAKGFADTYVGEGLGFRQWFVDLGQIGARGLLG